MQDKGLLKANLIHFCHTCAAHKIKCMPVVNYPVSWGKEDYLKAEGLAAYLVETLSGQPNLVCWDVANEPDNGRTREFTEQRIELARHMARTFKKIDPETPVTIGFAREESMEDHGDAVDVLSYHDYADTRKGIQSAIVRAKAYGAKMGKPVACTEIGCIARANPYDIALEEYMRARIGWFIWELMITRAWGDVHGIFYADGTIRDPAAVAALSGFFRNRSASVVTVVPDRENKVTRRVKNIKYWLGRTDGTWEEMLDLAESCANLIEAAELAPFHDLPTRQVELLRLGNPDMQKLRTLLAQYLLILEKYKTGNYLTRKTQVNYNGGE
ncbi:MAG: hypothetical protein K9M45_02315 [Kiritimatiellales bacterium]|nr:hypothetical protein [Kiritimatiellales bacterium]